MGKYFGTVISGDLGVRNRWLSTPFSGSLLLRLAGRLAGPATGWPFSPVASSLNGRPLGARRVNGAGVGADGGDTRLAYDLVRISCRRVLR